MRKTLITVVVLTKNEAANLPECLRSLSALDASVFIVDSGSQDETVQIATAYGCQVFTHKFENYSKQYNWALSNLPISSPWIMRLDADEHLTPELVEELSRVLPNSPPDTTAYMVKRRVYFWGRWIRHGGYYPTWLLRVWRRGLGVCEERFMDEHILVQTGTVMSLSHDLIDENRKGLTFWVGKHNGYADREVLDLLNRPDTAATLAGQPRRRRWVKERVYRRAPLFLRAFAYWATRYLFLLGFLDGIPGLVFHFLQGFWYRFLVDAKLFEEKRVVPSWRAREGSARKTGL